MMAKIMIEAFVCSAHFNIAEFRTDFERVMNRKMPLNFSISQSFSNEAASNSENENLPMTCWLESLSRYDFKKDVDNHNAILENTKFNINATDLLFSNTVSSLQDANVNKVISGDEGDAWSARGENEQNKVNHEEENHISDKSNVTSIKCDICGDQFKSINHLRTHHFICIKDKPYEYTECEQQFSNDKVFKIHLCKHLCLNWNSTQIHSNVISKIDIQRSNESEYLESEKNVKVMKNLEYSDLVLGDNSMLLKYKENDGSVSKNENNSGFISGDNTMVLKNKENFAFVSSDNGMVLKNEEIEVSNGNRIIDSQVELKIEENYLPNGEIKILHCDISEKTNSDKPTVSESIDDKLMKNIAIQPNSNSQRDLDINNKPYNCFECGLQISSFDNLKTHLGIPWKKHSMQNTTSSVSCNDHLVSQIFAEAFEPKSVVEHHCCNICDKSFETKKDLLVHLSLHLSIEPLKCTECDKQFVCYDALQKHLLSHSSQQNSQDLKKKLYKCKICSSSFVFRTRLNKHLRIHSNDREFECKLCGKGFNQKSTLRSHMLTHSGVKAHECSICNMKFGMKTSLTRHLQNHAGIKPYECDVCYYKFNTPGKLKQHYRRHTGEKPYECDKCGKKFKRRFGLNAHMAKHVGNLPYKCDVCNRKFYLNSTLTAHKQIHSKEKMFVCDICNKSYRSKHALKQHYRVHTNEKPYVCSDCNKSFANQAIYNRHILIHTGLKPYECKICQMVFNQKTSLDRHQVVHTKEKPYSCDICERSFTQKAYLSIHKRTHSKKKR